LRKKKKKTLNRNKNNYTVFVYLLFLITVFFVFIAMDSKEKTKKTSQGRKKIEIKQLTARSAQHVTFSKRRSGLFKKASELCVLTGAEIAIITESPGAKLFCFGHPNANTVLDRFLGGSPSHAGSSASTADAANPLPVEEFNRQYEESLKELEAERRRLAAVEEAKKMGNNRFLWEEPMDYMGLEELEQYLAAMKEMRSRLAAKANDHQSRNTASSMMLQPSYNYGADNVGAGNLQFGNLSWIVGGADNVGANGFGLGFGGQGHCN
jgi:pheromone receptor transcription factor